MPIPYRANFISPTMVKLEWNKDVRRVDKFKIMYKKKCDSGDHIVTTEAPGDSDSLELDGFDIQQDYVFTVKSVIEETESLSGGMMDIIKGKYTTVIKRMTM